MVLFKVYLLHHVEKLGNEIAVFLPKGLGHNETVIQTNSSYFIRLYVQAEHYIFPSIFSL
jgi:hypothetical protein